MKIDNSELKFVDPTSEPSSEQSSDPRPSALPSGLQSEFWSSVERASSRRVLEAARQLEIPFVAQLNAEEIPEREHPGGRCNYIAAIRMDGSSQGIQVWHELKTVVIQLEYQDNRKDEVVFVHLRANRFVDFGKVAAWFGASAAKHLPRERLQAEGWRHGCVNPLTSLLHRHLFDVDLGRRYSHRGEVWTNFGHGKASIRFQVAALMESMERRRIADRSCITSGPSEALARIDRMLRAKLLVLAGNPPFLVQEYLDLWLQAQHRFLNLSQEIHHEVQAQGRAERKRVGPDGDQWFTPFHMFVSGRGGPINQIGNPIYRDRIMDNDRRSILMWCSHMSVKHNSLLVLDVPDPSSAAYFDDAYRSLAQGRMQYLSILESVEETLEEILAPRRDAIPGFAPPGILKARDRIAGMVRPRVLVLAGKTTLAPEGPTRERLVKRFVDRIDWIFPDEHVHELQDALEGLKKVREGSSRGTKIKKIVKDVVFHPSYGVDEQTIILRMAGEFRCLKQEKDTNRYGRNMVFLDCLEAHVYQQLIRILEER